MHQLKKIGCLNREGMTACNAGRTGDALASLEEAGRLASEMGSPLHVAKIRNNVGLVHQMAGNYDEAASCFRQAERLAVEQAGDGNPLHRVVVRNLSRLELSRCDSGACHSAKLEQPGCAGSSCRV